MEAFERAWNAASPADARAAERRDINRAREGSHLNERMAAAMTREADAYTLATQIADAPLPGRTVRALRVDPFIKRIEVVTVPLRLRAAREDPSLQNPTLRFAGLEADPPAEMFGQLPAGVAPMCHRSTDLGAGWEAFMWASPDGMPVGGVQGFKLPHAIMPHAFTGIVVLVKKNSRLTRHFSPDVLDFMRGGGPDEFNHSGGPIPTLHVSRHLDGPPTPPLWRIEWFDRPRGLPDSRARFAEVCTQVAASEGVPPPLILTPSCAHCGGKNARLLTCSQCHVARYCSRECQTQHWSAHKPTCKPTHGK